MPIGWLRSGWRRFKRWLRSTSIPTPIPKHLIRLVQRLRRGSIWLTLYRIALIVAGTGVFLAALTSTSVLLATVATIALFALIAEDVGQTARDIWNGNFWRV